jgi:hypothetical protein
VLVFASFMLPVSPLRVVPFEWMIVLPSRFFRDADKIVLWFPPLPSLVDINEHWRSIDGQARRYLVC